MQIMFKNKTRLDNNFHFKDRISKDLTSVVYKLQCGHYNESYYDECVEQEHHIGTIIPIRQALVVRSLFEFYLFLVVATSSLFNELFIILPNAKCISTTVRVCSIDLLCYKIEKDHITYCITCNLIFLSLKLENGLKKHVRNVAEIKYGIVKLVLIFFIYSKSSTRDLL